MIKAYLYNINADNLDFIPRYEGLILNEDSSFFIGMYVMKNGDRIRKVHSYHASELGYVYKLRLGCI